MGSHVLRHSHFIWRKDLRSADVDGVRSVHSALDGEIRIMRDMEQKANINVEQSTCPFESAKQEKRCQ